MVTGCPTEVSYPDSDAAESGAVTENLDEAPAFDEEGASTADPEIDDPESFEPDPPVDRYASPPETAPTRMPWETDDEAAETTEDVPDLFAKTEVTPPAGRYADADPDPESDDDEDEGSGYADFLANAYPELADKALEEETAPEEQVDEEAPAVAKLGTEPEPSVVFVPENVTPAPEPVAIPIPKLPTTTAQADSVMLDDLWADAIPQLDESTLPTAPRAKPKPVTPAREEEPIAAYDLPPAREPEVVEEQPFDEPTEPETPARVELPFSSPPVAKTLPEPEPEPEPEPLWVAEPEPRRTPPPRTPSPRSTPARTVESLPSVPVLTFNTRHLAWLLGGKLALAELADLEGATPGEISGWTAEVERLARELRIRNPLTSSRSTDPATRVKEMMDAASRAGGDLARAYGADHSALLEIAVKSNTLLIVAADRPDLATPVADAVRSASDDAMLPRYLWGDSVRTLAENPTANDATGAVELLHQRVESFLR